MIWCLRTFCIAENRGSVREKMAVIKRTVQFIAAFWPHEQVAFCWQTHVSALPQQVVGLLAVSTILRTNELDEDLSDASDFPRLLPTS